MKKIKQTDRQFVKKIWESDWMENMDCHLLSDAIEYLSKLEARIKTEVPDAFEISLDSDYRGYDGAKDFYVTYLRPETDIEMNARLDKLAAETNRKRVQEHEKSIKELAELKRLMKKYPNEVTK